MIARVSAALLASALLAAPLSAKEFTVRTGESWIFTIRHGHADKARRVAADSLPARGEIRVTARRMMGTTVTMLNNSATAYTFRATLVGLDGKALTAKSCVLPANNRLAMESWPQVAAAVRLSDFKATTAANCR
jgi:hypothetical protein